MKLAHCGLLILLAATCVEAPGATASAQQSPGAQSASARNQQNQTDPLAAAARRAREKRKDQSKPAKVWDNDNIPTSGGVDVIGPSAQNSSEEANAGESAPKAAEPAKKEDQSTLAAELKSAKENLKNLQMQLDFAQRKLGLDQHDFYQNPNNSSDAAGAQALKGEQSQIDAKKQDVAAAQQKVDDLTAKVQAAASKSLGEPSSDQGSK